MKPPTPLRLAGPGQFTRVGSVPELVGSDGCMAELAPAAERSFTWGPAFGDGGLPVRLPGSRERDHGMRLTALRDAWLSTGGAVVASDGAVVLDGLVPYAAEIPAAPQKHAQTFAHYGLGIGADGALEMKAGSPHAIEEPVFHLLCQADGAFTHFMMETLPKLALWHALPAPRPRLLVSHTAWQHWRELLFAVAGCGEDGFVVHRPGTQTVVRQVYVASFPRWLHEAGIAPLRRAGEHLPAGRRRIFVARHDPWAWDRMLLNEREIAARLERRGFELVVPAGLDMQARLALYRSARIVAGAFGGGLLNAIFSAPGTRVLSIVSPDFIRPLLDSASEVTGLRTAHALGESFSALRDRNNSPYVVDPAAVDAALDVLEAG